MSKVPIYSRVPLCAVTRRLAYAVRNDGVLQATDFGIGSYDSTGDSWDGLISVSTEHLSVFEDPEEVFGLSAQGNVYGKFYGSMNSENDRAPKISDIIMISNADEMIVGLKADGTVVGDVLDLDYDPNGLESYEEYAIPYYNPSAVWGTMDWKNIVKIEVWGGVVLGLTSHGEILISGAENTDLRKTGIPTSGFFIDISLGKHHCMALKDDGTVVAWGSQNDYGELDVSLWADVIHIAAGATYASFAVKSDNTVYFTGWDYWNTTYNEYQVTEILNTWTNIVALYAGDGIAGGEYTSLVGVTTVSGECRYLEYAFEVGSVYESTLNSANGFYDIKPRYIPTHLKETKESLTEVTLSWEWLYYQT